MTKTIAALIAALALLLAGCDHNPVEPTVRAAHQLAPTGTLRVAVLTSNPIIGVRDSKTGEITGTTATLAAQLAKRADVQVRMLEFTAVPLLMQQVNAGLWDIAVLAIDPAPPGGVDLAPVHLVAEATQPDGKVVSTRFAFALPRNRPEASRFVAEFVEEIKRTGEIQNAIDAAGIKDGLRPAKFD